MYNLYKPCCRRFFFHYCAHIDELIQIDTVKLQFGTENLNNWKYDNGAQFNLFCNMFMFIFNEHEMKTKTYKLNENKSIRVEKKRWSEIESKNNIEKKSINKTCLQLQISVCHVIKLNRYVLNVCVLRPLK